MPRLDQQVRLSDGRMLGYDERGCSDGTPLFYFHGSPSSRLEAGLYIEDDLLHSLKFQSFAGNTNPVGTAFIEQKIDRKRH